MALLALLLLAAVFASAVALPLTAKEETSALARHNYHRCMVSPKAQSMPRMVWDVGLAQVAQRYANTCPDDHNSQRSAWYKALTSSNDYVGENLAWGYATLDTAIDAFVSEVSDYNFAANTCVPGRMCGHYTQVVWADSVRVGCARVNTTCPGWSDRVYVCNYAPGGNYVGQRPYTPSSSVGACSPTTDACVAAGQAQHKPANLTYTMVKASHLKAAASSARNGFGSAALVNGVHNDTAGWRPKSSDASAAATVTFSSRTIGRVTVFFRNAKSVPPTFTVAVLDATNAVRFSSTLSAQPNARKYMSTLPSPVAGAVGVRLSMPQSTVAHVAEIVPFVAASSPIAC